MKMSNKKRREDIVLLVAGIFFLSVFCITGFLLLDYWVESYKQENLSKQLAELKHGSTDTIVLVEAEPISTAVPENSGEEVAYESEEQPQKTPKNEPETEPSLTEINPDYVMWIQIDDTKIDYPVVQRDNSYYLKHDFMGEKNNHGTIFLDESCELEDMFLLLHGHHMKDGTMFGGLKEYKKADFREKHKELTLSWETEEENYEFFAGASIDLLNPECFHFEVLPQSEEELKTYLQQLKDASFWYESPEWEEDTRFVVLSTCDYGTEEQRLILVALGK